MLLPFAVVRAVTMAFAVVEVVASAGFKTRIHEERPDVVMFGAVKLASVSVSGGLGVAFGDVLLVDGIWAWAVVPSAGSRTGVVMLADTASSPWADTRPPRWWTRNLPADGQQFSPACP